MHAVSLVHFLLKSPKFYSWEQQPEPWLFETPNMHLKYLRRVLIMSSCSRYEKLVACFVLYRDGHNHLYHLGTQKKKYKTDFTSLNMNSISPM